jgi:hypothetical protein
VRCKPRLTSTVGIIGHDACLVVLQGKVVSPAWEKAEDEMPGTEKGLLAEDRVSVIRVVAITRWRSR